MIKPKLSDSEKAIYSKTQEKADKQELEKSFMFVCKCGRFDLISPFALERLRNGSNWGEIC
jgi:hypothetical protein